MPWEYFSFFEFVKIFEMREVESDFLKMYYIIPWFVVRRLMCCHGRKKNMMLMFQYLWGFLIFKKLLLLRNILVQNKSWSFDLTRLPRNLQYNFLFPRLWFRSLSKCRKNNFPFSDTLKILICVQLVVTFLNYDLTIFGL